MDPSELLKLEKRNTFKNMINQIQRDNHRERKNTNGHGREDSNSSLSSDEEDDEYDDN